MVNAEMGEEWINTTEICILCRNPSLTVSEGSKYCAVCYKEMITNKFLNRYPVSGKDLKERLYKHES
tara:strand:- start:139 stop:339 length:201 start_codon:yes stop_codon:yes gene_type:complete